MFLTDISRRIVRHRIVLRRTIDKKMLTSRAVRVEIEASNEHLTNETWERGDR